MAKHTPNRLLSDAFREIKNTRSRFISLMILSALAVCFLAGLRATAPDMKRSADLYLDQQKLMDLRIVSTLGLTEEDAAALTRQPGVAAVERAQTVDAILHLTEKDYIVKVLSFTENPGLNAPKIVEGRLPQTAEECLVEPRLLQENDLQIGDVISLDTGTGSFEDALHSGEFTIVGMANSPLYVGTERGSSSLGTGKVAAFVLLPLEAFALDYYTDLYLQLEGAAELDCYSDDYTDLIDQFKDALEPLADQRAQLRGDEVIDEAKEKLTDAEQELADAEAEAEQELSDAWAELTDARKELDDGWREYREGQQELRDKVAEARQEIADGEQELANALVELQDGEQEYADALPELEDARKELADAKQELADGWQEYHDGLETWKAGYYVYEMGQTQYEQGWAQYQQGLDGVQQLYAGAEQAQQGAAQATAGAQQARQGATQATDGAQQLKAQAAQVALINPALAQQLLAQAQEYELQAQQLQAQAQQLDAAAAQATAQAQQLQSQAQQLEAQLEASLPQLQSSQLELQANYLQLNKAKQELDEAKEELDKGQQEYDDGLQELADAEQELADARKELDDGWQEYNDGLAEVADAKQTLEDEVAHAQAELADALIKLNDGEEEYADGLQEYEDGKAEADEKIADARKELEQARRDIEDIEECEWYLLGRNTNMGYISYSMDADRMGNLASVFPLIFFLVAALVCLTTMTRMVEEQRITIGGMKALGYSKGAIAIKYVGYGFLASAIGALLGLAVGLTLLPWIICNAWNIIYTLGPVQYGLEPVTSGLACLAAIGTVTLAALGACFSTLTAVPAQLMRPKAPPVGKRVLLEHIPFLWRRLSFNYKITIRNLFRYQRRFWMTVVGIGGCAALIVTAFGLRDSIFDVMDKQYDEIYNYTAQVGLVDKVTPGELREVTRALDASDLVEKWMACRSESVTAEAAAYTVDCTLHVVQSQEALAPFVNLRHRTDDQPVVLPDDGVILTEKLASLLGVKAGDTFTLDGEKRVEVRVADVTEHYIQHYIYMTDACYQSLFGLEPQNNLVLADYPVESEGTEDLERALVALDGVTSLSRIIDTRKTFTSSLESVDYAVVLIIVCAAALAFVVLYNLTNINITERLRELATLKVLGFYDGELSAYVYRENVILTVFGVALGMLMGKLLHQWLILTVEIDLLMFGRTLAPTSYAYAVVLTVIFSLLVNLAAHKKLKKLDMVESLKTVE